MRHRRLTAIVAHMGAPDYQAFLRLAADYERVALDTTMIFTEFFDELARSRPPRCRWCATSAGRQDLAGQRFPEHPLPYARQLTGLERLGLATRGCARCAGRIRSRCSARRL